MTVYYITVNDRLMPVVPSELMGVVILHAIEAGYTNYEVKEV